MEIDDRTTGGRTTVATVIGILALLALGSAAGCGTGARADGGESTTKDSGRVAGPMEGGARSATDSGAGDAGGSAVTGVVVEFYTQRPLTGRTVTILGHGATTDANGAFTLTSIPPTYDVAVVEGDGSTVSVFHGLTTRAPLLVHHASTLANESNRNSATVTETLSGAGYALDAGSDATVYLFSTQFAVALGSANTLLRASWAGAPEIAGQVVALVSGGAVDDAGDAAVSTWFGSQATDLANGQALSLALALTRVPFARVTGMVNVPPMYQLTQFLQFYGTAFPNATIDVIDRAMFGVLSVPFDETIPDLRSAGETPCVAVVSTSSGTLWTKLCGADILTRALSVTLQAPPTLAVPPAGAMITEGARFLWSAFDDGVHGLALEPDFARATDPAMYIYTAGTTEAWPDLTTEGVELPAEATYHCTIEGLGPYATMDDAFGPAGLGAISAPELRRSAAAPVDVTFAP